MWTITLKFIKNVLEKSTIINTSILSKISDEYEIHETENKSYCIVVNDNTIALFYPISNKIHLKFTNEWIGNGTEWLQNNLLDKK